MVLEHPSGDPHRQCSFLTGEGMHDAKYDGRQYI
jgi:hypothetical protein